MSYNIFTFLEIIVEKKLPDLALKNHYFGAGIIAGGIEFMGACLDAHLITDVSKSAPRFCQAVNELFPSAYHQFSRQSPYTKHQKPTHDLYSSLRCGMAHVLRPQGVFLTGSVMEATQDGTTHLQILTRGTKIGPLIVVEQFAADFVTATKALRHRLNLAPIPAKLQGDILEVWDK